MTDAIAKLRERFERDCNDGRTDITYTIADYQARHILKELRNVDDVTAVATDPGNALADEYMRGMANGLILAQSILKGTEPEYIEATGSEPTMQERIDKSTAK
jgi:hypothetical protein